MRILFLTRGLPPDAIGGTEIYTQMVASGLQTLGHKVTVVCIGGWTEGARYFNGATADSYHGVEVIRLHLNWQRAQNPNRYLYDNPVVAQFLDDCLNRIDPDVVHVTSCDRLSASIIPAAKNAGFPVVLSLTDFWFLCPTLKLVRWDGQLCDGNTTPWECLRCSLGSNRAYTSLAGILPEDALQATLTAISKRSSLTRHRGLRGLALNAAERKDFVRHALRLADYVTIATPFGARLFENVFPEVSVHVTPYGHDLSWLEGYSGKTPSKELRVGYIAALCEAKGPQILLDAFRRFPSTAAIRLSIYGNLPEDDFGKKLRDMASGNPQVRFCGCYDHEKSAEIYSHLDVLVVPSLWYDFPLVAHEALVTGTVVVATDLPGLNEIVKDEVNGLLFERGNADALAAQLQRLEESRELVANLQTGKRQIRCIEDAVVELQGIYSELTSARHAEMGSECKARGGTCS
ncbi:MAG: glycosyltransferase [Bryobacteraceae bacterium]